MIFVEIYTQLLHTTQNTRQLEPAKRFSLDLEGG